jgi:hypothetical protein
MADIYGYILLPVKVRNVQIHKRDFDLADDVSDRLRDLQLDHKGVEFWGEDMGFGVQVVEATTEVDAVVRLAKRVGLRGMLEIQQ